MGCGASGASLATAAAPSPDVPVGHEADIEPQKLSAVNADPTSAAESKKGKAEAPVVDAPPAADEPTEPAQAYDEQATEVAREHSAEPTLPAVEIPSPDDCPYPPNYAPPLPTRIVGTYSTHGLMPQPWGLPPVKVNQDYGTVLYPCGGAAEQILFTVLDGHGRNGTRASQTAAHVINETVERGIGRGDTLCADIPALLIKACNAAHDSLDTDAERDDFEASGSTCVLCAMVGSELWVGNVGDSRVVLGQVDGTTAGLTKDHKVDDPGERERIVAQGGVISENEGEAARVVAHNEHGTRFALGMSRSIGDLRFPAVGVSHTADVVQHSIADYDKWLVMATDGIWEFISNEEAIEIVRDTWERSADATMACRALIARAKQVWEEVEGDYRDDITVTVVDLQALLAHTAEQPATGSEASPPGSPPRPTPASPESVQQSVMQLEPPTVASTGHDEVTYNENADAFMKRRSSVLPTNIAAEEVTAAVAIADPNDAGAGARSPKRRPSISPEMDMKLWPQAEATAAE